MQTYQWRSSRGRRCSAALLIALSGLTCTGLAASPTDPPPVGGPGELAIQLPSPDGQLALGKNFTYFRTSQPRSFNAILTDAKFEPVNSLSFGETTDQIWVKLVFKNPHSELARPVLHINYPTIDLVKFYVAPKNLGPVQSEPTNSGFRMVQTGLDFSQSQRPLDYQTFALPLKFAPGDWSTLYIRVSSKHPIVLPIYIHGEEEWPEFRNQEAMANGLHYGFLLVMLVYNLFLWGSIREKAYFYYVVYLGIFIVTAAGLTGDLNKYVLTEPSMWRDYATVFFTGFSSWSVIQFGRYFSDTPRLVPRLDFILKLIGYADFTNALVAPLVGDVGLSHQISRFFLLLGTAYGTPVMYYLWLGKKSRPAFFFLLAFTILLVGATMYVLSYNLDIDLVVARYALQISSGLEVVVLSLGLADRINILQRDLKDLNEGLEQQVEDRTRQLSERVDEIQALKIKQDADYYLTTLLLGPLQKQPEEWTGSIKAQVVTEQKKKVEFKHHRTEIGGDFCAAEQLVLGQRRYFFFVNADAMGKSIQGAGGALVFGAFLKAELIQAKLGKSRHRLPELWLRDRCRDLHELFLTFDGSMLVSMVMGLIDEETRLLYFINSEHPNPVLYRDGVAKFIGQPANYRKLGTPLLQAHLQVETFALSEGDQIIVGSDGKDDLILQETTETGEPKTNEDETLFLRHLEDAQGKIDDMPQRLRKVGAIKDDLSLVAVTIGAQEKRAPNLAAEDLELIRKYARGNDYEAMYKTVGDIYHRQPFNLRDPKFVQLLYDTAKVRSLPAEFLEVSYHTYFLKPHRSDIVLGLARQLYKRGQHSGAADFSEALLVREPNNMENLDLLIRIYADAGVDERVNYLLQRCRSMNGTAGAELEEYVKEKRAELGRKEKYERIQSAGSLLRGLLP